MTSDPDDSELIARSLDGDQDAFVEVVRRHEAAVGAYLARRAGRDLAEDLLGEVWVAALASRATYDRSFPDARPWLFGVAHNTLRRHWRSRPAEHPPHGRLRRRRPGRRGRGVSAGADVAPGVQPARRGDRPAVVEGDDGRREPDP